MRPYLKDVTLIIVDCVNYEEAKLALDHCRNCCSFGSIKLLTHFDIPDDPFIIKIPKISSREEYSNFIVKELYKFFDTSHVLVAQWDGFILNPDRWTDEFLNYDYIGAPWPKNLLGEGVPEHFIVGNGGFSLRSKKLQDFLGQDPRIEMTHKAEDVLICQQYRSLLEEQGFIFAPLEIAQQFSHENDPVTDSFGVHARIKLVSGKPKEKKLGKIYDCFLYNGEFKMLNFRMHELDHLVDYFVIGESEYTFKGDKRELDLPKQFKHLSKFNHKIIYVPHSDPPYVNAWDNERNQRNHIQMGLVGYKLNTNDLIMLSDVDEIPDVKYLEKISVSGFTGIGTFYQNFHYYNFKCRSKYKWEGTIFFNYGSGYLKLGFDQLRSNRYHLPKIGSDGNYTSGGWHLSYFGDTDFIIRKIQSFSHQEFNTPRYTDPKVIEECIKSGSDLFFRKNEHFELISNNEYLPKFSKLLE